ncbi:MAG TPA: ABC transporter permease [Bacillota bacterium]
MRTYLIRRLLHTIVVLWLVSVITFLLIHLTPGGPAVLAGMDYTAEQREQIRRAFGLDRPLPERYVSWLGDVLRGDFGMTLNTSMDIGDLLAERLPPTLLLAGSALLLSVVIGVPVGVLSALRPYSAYDYVVTVASFIGVAVPSFWLAILLILAFAVELQWLPSSGLATVGAPFSLADRLRHLLMPMLVMSTITLPYVIRFTRSAMLEVLRRDYVRTARAKGLGRMTVVVRHALRNALFPVITVVGLQLPRLVSGSVVTEQVFAWPGMGRLAVTAAVGRDYPLIMAVTMVVSAVVLLTNLLVDVLYGLLDPRVRFG